VGHNYQNPVQDNVYLLHLEENEQKREEMREEEVQASVRTRRAGYIRQAANML
jgi:hypothetical protein